MRRIYENAEQVLVWLGEGATSSGIAMHVLEELGECEETDDILYLRFPEDTTYKKIWLSVKLLLQRPWWYRICVIQEVVSARKCLMYCGDRSMFLECLRRAMRNIVTYQGRIDSSNLEFVKKIDLSFAAELCETRRLKGHQTPGLLTTSLYEFKVTETGKIELSKISKSPLSKYNSVCFIISETISLQ
jgi:hypothetical protein